MTQIDVDGEIYFVSEPLQDPSTREVRRDGELVGKIGVFGDHYRFYSPDGAATSHLAPGTPQGIDQLVRAAVQNS